MNTTPRYSIIAALLASSVGLLAGCASSQDKVSSAAPPEVIGTMDFRSTTIPVYRNARANMSAPPVYPPAAQQDGISGAGLVRIVVDKTGEAIDYAIVGSTPTPDFGRAALAAAQRWQYFPMNGADDQPIVYALEIAVNFGSSPPTVKWVEPPQFRPSSYESYPK